MAEWDKLSKPPINGTWRVSVSDEIESQVLRLEEVCKQIDSLTQMFIVTLIVTIFWSFTRFVCRQWLIFEQSLRSNWKLPMVF